ncbi:MAG: hypothetical protein LUD69_03160 [Oscillospiraceae bacterium]|nr:hypothetical protein [Oscillospiraceae bacterium]
MQLQDVLESRRSVRAPSRKSSQTARYCCVYTPERAEKFSSGCLPPFNAVRPGNAQ